jgi:hypothetical protein
LSFKASVLPSGQTKQLLRSNFASLPSVQSGQFFLSTVASLPSAHFAQLERSALASSPLAQRKQLDRSALASVPQAHFGQLDRSALTRVDPSEHFGQLLWVASASVFLSGQSEQFERSLLAWFPSKHFSQDAALERATPFAHITQPLAGSSIPSPLHFGQFERSELASVFWSAHLGQLFLFGSASKPFPQ